LYISSLREGRGRGRGFQRTAEEAPVSTSALLRVAAASPNRDRDGLLVFFVGVVLFCVAAAVYLLADLLVAAAPVVMLASGVAIASVSLPPKKLAIKTLNSECGI
jgi:hypothetical protein